jgi:anti-anti-sigma factor
MSASLRLRESTGGQTTTLAVSGDLDLESAPELEGAVRRLCIESGHHVLLDLSDVSFVDTVGMRTLVTCKTLFEEADCGYWLVPPRAQARRMLEQYGLLEQMPLLEDAPQSR